MERNYTPPSLSLRSGPRGLGEGVQRAAPTDGQTDPQLQGEPLSRPPGGTDSPRASLINIGVAMTTSRCQGAAN